MNYTKKLASTWNIAQIETWKASSSLLCFISDIFSSFYKFFYCYFSSEQTDYTNREGNPLLSNLGRERKPHTHTHARERDTNQQKSLAVKDNLQPRDNSAYVALRYIHPAIQVLIPRTTSTKIIDSPFQRLKDLLLSKEKIDRSRKDRFIRQFMLQKHNYADTKYTYRLRPMGKR